MLGDSSMAAGIGAQNRGTSLRGARKSDDQHIPAAITDVGCEREINEDRYAVVDAPSGRGWIVCDGMGGSLGGELAAQLAIDAVRRALEARDFETTSEALRTAIEEANRIIVLRRQNPAFSAMGTTVVAALVQNDEVVITHAGDSRAYLVRNGELQQLTVDHTYVQDLVDRGAITQEEAMTHPQSHVLTRCLGADPRIELESQNYWIWELGEGETQDKLVLCSDGLYSLVGDEEIAEIVSSRTPQEACVQLVELAKVRGGYDNITLAVLPLEGRLHEEEPIGPRRTTRKNTMKTAKRTKRRRRLSTGQRVVIAMTLSLLAIIFGVLVVLLGFGG